MTQQQRRWLLETWWVACKEGHGSYTHGCTGHGPPRIRDCARLSYQGQQYVTIQCSCMNAEKPWSYRDRLYMERVVWDRAHKYPPCPWLTHPELNPMVSP